MTTEYTNSESAIYFLNDRNIQHTMEFDLSSVVNPIPSMTIFKDTALEISSNFFDKRLSNACSGDVSINANLSVNSRNGLSGVFVDGKTLAESVHDEVQGWSGGFVGAIRNSLSSVESELSDITEDSDLESVISGVASISRTLIGLKRAIDAV